MLNKRKNRIKSTLVIAIVLFYFACGAQDNNYKFVSNLKVGELVKRPNQGSNEEVVYLGNIKSESGKPIFNVITVYSTVKASNVYHGHSSVIYLDLDFKIVKRFELGERCDLPKELSNNVLFFEYKDENGKEKIYRNEVGHLVPKLLCVAPDDCY